MNHLRLRALLLVLALWPLAARAENDSFGLGTGRSGRLDVTDAGVVINRYAVLTQARAPGDGVLPVSSNAGFASGDLVLVYQTTGLLPVPASGDANHIGLTGTPVGRWELGRVLDTADGGVTLTAPLANTYAASATQVIRVPEYTDVTVSPGASLQAAPWDGASGGVLAFLASGAVANDGELTVNSAGFRGGVALDDNPPNGNSGCSALDEAPGMGGEKGDGIAPSPFGGTRYGMGNVANGAGGGDCHDSGGGGGANAGPGGKGGFSWSGDGARDVGGRGGAPLVYSPLDRLVFGGGGGAGYEHESVDSSGARGGGAILVRAGSLSGSGRIGANGGSAPFASGSGGGGGGAGGTVYLRIAGSAGCGSAEAKGGNGAPTDSNTGPGGGGGGGSILIQAASLACPTLASSGSAGLDNTSGTLRGAEPSGDPTPFQGSAVLLDGGYVQPPPPVLTTPADGLQTVDPRPAFTGSASPGMNVVLLVDGLELARVPASDAGTFSYLPGADFTLGTHRAEAQTESQLAYSAKTAANAFTVVVDAGTPDAGTSDSGTPDAGAPEDGGADAGSPEDAGAPDAGPPVNYRVGCGCGAAPDALAYSLGLALAALVARRANRRGRSRAP